MGGVIAMGITGLLEERGESVIWLGMIDSYLVRDTLADEPLEDLVMTLGGRLASAFVSLPADEQARLRAELGNLSLQERVERAIVWARGRGLIDQGLRPEMLRRQATLSALHRRMMHDHKPPVVNAPLSLWWAGELLAGEPRTDWRPYTRAGIRFESEIPGNHYSIMQPPHVQTLGKQLGASLAAATDSAGSTAHDRPV
jgi:thioesterase domain-containing protein